MDPLFLLLLLAVLAIPLFLGSRRQKKAAAQAQALQNSLEEGDRVMTTSGMYATVLDTSDDDTIDLEIAPGVYTTWVRAAIREKVVETDEDETDLEDVEDVEDTAGPVAQPQAAARPSLEKAAETKARSDQA